MKRRREARVSFGPHHREDYTYIFGTVLRTLLDPIFRRPTQRTLTAKAFLGSLYIAICDALYDANDTQRDWDALTIGGALQYARSLRTPKHGIK
jgi:hypothetical protein